MKDKNFYITTPIYYVNDKPHIGHAYTSVACDVLARFMRLDGKNVKFLTGTDEHGQKVEKAAAAAGKSPQSFVDEVSTTFRELTGLMHISNDDFIRTTEERHKKAAQALWQEMEKNGHIYLGSYAGWYSVRDEAYFAESELVDGKAPTGAPVEWVEEPSYFFRLSAFDGKLLEHYERNSDFILPKSRRNEVVSFVKGGLKDLSISRTTFNWGIPVPGNPKHVMYVWLDALTNYLSALGYPDTQTPDFKSFWPASLHMVGKDILRFHAVYWPAFLMAANLPLPERVFAHGWWTVEGEKMSKSLGNAIAPAELVNEFAVDQLRYFLLREVPFGNDGDFSRDRITTVINTELANNIGNLAQRTLTMIAKNCGGKVPEHHGLAKDAVHLEFLQKAQVTDSKTPRLVEQEYRECQFGKILTDIREIGVAANSYIDTLAPWKQKKDNPQLMEATLYHMAEGVRCLAIMLQPFMPQACATMLQLVGYSEEKAKAGVFFNELKPEFALKPGTSLPEPKPVFPRIEAKAEAANAG